MKLTSIPLYNLIVIWEYDKCIIIGQQFSEDNKINDIDNNVNDDAKAIIQDIKTYDVLQIPRTYCPIIEVY